MQHADNSAEVLRIVFEEDANRSAAYIGGEHAGECEVSIDGDIWTITHTGVRPEYGGRGIAKLLVRKVIETARAKRARIVPQCSYAAKMMADKEEFADVLA